MRSTAKIYSITGDQLFRLSLLNRIFDPMLKKLTSWFFIILVLLNVFGYYGIFVGLQYSNTREMIRQFDADIYDNEEVRTFKIPQQSTQSSETYERVDGVFEKHGDVFRLIKQRLYRDTFHIVYMKDKTATAIKNTIQHYVQSFSDHSQDESQTTMLPIFIREYFSRPFKIEHISMGFQSDTRKESPIPVFIDSFMSSIVHPPERL
jgi:hypothetical protein